MVLDPLAALSDSSPFSPNLSLNKQGRKVNNLLLQQHCTGRTYPKFDSDFLTLLEAIVHVGGWGLILLCQLFVPSNEPVGHTKDATIHTGGKATCPDLKCSCRATLKSNASPLS